MTGLEYLLKLADWQIFGTLTWRESTLGTIRSRECDVSEYLQHWAAREHLSLTEMPLVIRWERGEIGERPHCHFLLHGFPHLHQIDHHRRMNQMMIWARKFGLTKIRRFYSSLREEVAKYLTVEPNSYEIGKFNSADRLVINEAAWRRWKTMRHASFDVAPCT